MTPLRTPLLLLALAALAIPSALGLKRLAPANPDLAEPVIGPGGLARIIVGEPIRSIAGRWDGSAPGFRPDGEDPSAGPPATHDDSWGRLMGQEEGTDPSFRPTIELRLKDDPGLAGREFRGEASLSVRYPAPVGGAGYETKEEALRRSVTLRVLTRPQRLAARAAHGLMLVGVFAGVLAFVTGAWAVTSR